MAWLALAAALLAVAFHQVGTLSVWVSVLSFTLKVAVAVLAAVATVGAFLYLRRRLQG